MQYVKAISVLSFCASGVHPFLTRINSPQLVCDLPDAAPVLKRLAQKHLFEKFEVAEAMLTGREWFFDHFTAADAHFFWCFRRGTLFPLDQSQFKNCTAHFERMKQRSSVQKLLAFEQEVQDAFARAA